MNLQQQRTLLRTQLLDMSRLSQRALDYSIKGYEFNRSEFSLHTGSIDRQLKCRYNQIKLLSRQLIITGVADPSDFRFSSAAIRLNSAFYQTYKAASRIARATTENNTIYKSAALVEFGNLTNDLVRLCTVTLFLGDARHAETVLHSQAAWRLSELILQTSHSAEENADGTLAITQNLSVIVRQAHEMAEALLFWLKGKDCVPSLSPRRSALSHHYSARQQNRTRPQLTAS